MQLARAPSFVLSRRFIYNVRKASPFKMNANYVSKCVCTRASVRARPMRRADHAHARALARVPARARVLVRAHLHLRVLARWCARVRAEVRSCTADWTQYRLLLAKHRLCPHACLQAHAVRVRMNTPA
eukprot:5744888-Pleurochrysis_carterae.AAC.3